MQGTSIHLQGRSLVGIIVGWLFWVFTMDYLRATVDSLASALGKNTFGRSKIRDGRHSFCKWDPEVPHRVGHHSRPQWEQTATISNFAPPKRVFGHSTVYGIDHCEQGFVKINVSNASFSTSHALQIHIVEHLGDTPPFRWRPRQRQRLRPSPPRPPQY